MSKGVWRLRLWCRAWRGFYKGVELEQLVFRIEQWLYWLRVSLASMLIGLIAWNGLQWCESGLDESGWFTEVCPRLVSHPKFKVAVQCTNEIEQSHLFLSLGRQVQPVFTWSLPKPSDCSKSAFQGMYAGGGTSPCGEPCRTCLLSALRITGEDAMPQKGTQRARSYTQTALIPLSFRSSRL